MSFVGANDHPNPDSPDDPLYYAPRSARSRANVQFPGNYLSAEAQLRFNGQRQLRRPYSSISRSFCSSSADDSDAPWKLLVRDPVHQLAVSHDLLFEFNTLGFRRHLRVPGVALLTIETGPTPRIDPGEGADGAAQRGGGWRWERRSRFRDVNPTSSVLRCRRTATASLFLGRNRTSDSTRIPVWISLLKPGVGGSKFYPAGRRARMPAAFHVRLRDVLGSPG